jgi:Ca2+-transporting ATPase
MDAKEWIISLALGFVALPLGALIRLIPTEPCERVFVKLRLLPKPEEEPTFPSSVESSFASAVDCVPDNLGICQAPRWSHPQFTLCSQESFDCP